MAAGERVLVTTLTKKMAEDLTDYLLEMGVRVRYLHSEVDTLQRIELIRDLRLGEFDVLVGINLLREGLDIPEVSLVAILDADKEGFLRSETLADPDDRSGGAQRERPGRHVRRRGHRLDDDRRSSETNRRRGLQQAYNETHGIHPQTIRKAVTDILADLRGSDGSTPMPGRRPAPAAPRRTGPSRAVHGPSPRRPRGASSPCWRRRCTRPRPTCASRRRPACATRSRSSGGSCAPPAPERSRCPDLADWSPFRSCSPSGFGAR